MFTKSVPEQFETKAFGELTEGDVVLGPNDEEVTVKVAYPPHVPERMYELVMADGTTIEASGNHLWYIEPEADRLAHSTRVANAKELLKGHSGWHEEAEVVATSSTPYEIGVEDLMNFFDFIPSEEVRSFFIQRICASIGHIAEEEVTYEDYFTHETAKGSFEFVYDARRVFQQALALTGLRKYSKRWPVIVGRVVTTDVLYHRYPDADIPTPKR